jgi:hypothetical protein
VKSAAAASVANECEFYIASGCREYGKDEKWGLNCWIYYCPEKYLSLNI